MIPRISLAVGFLLALTLTLVPFAAQAQTSDPGCTLTSTATSIPGYQSTVLHACYPSSTCTVSTTVSNTYPSQTTLTYCVKITPAPTSSSTNTNPPSTWTLEPPVQTHLGQCGGRWWQGPTWCMWPWKCVYINDAYSTSLAFEDHTPVLMQMSTSQVNASDSRVTVDVFHKPREVIRLRYCLYVPMEFTYLWCARTRTMKSLPITLPRSSSIGFSKEYPLSSSWFISNVTFHLSLHYADWFKSACPQRESLELNGLIIPYSPRGSPHSA